MPLLGFPEQGLDPDGAFAQGLLVAGGLVVGLDSLQILGVEGAMNRPTARTSGAGGLNRARITDGRRGPIHDQFFGVLGRPAWKPLAFGTLVLIPLAVIAEPRRAIEGRSIPVGQRDVGPDA